jgi:branched-chain amino acid transport system ATP-binding protein
MSMSLLSLEHVSVDFGGHRAVDDVTFTADAGRVTGLIGPNGAGKTTTFNVVTGLQVATRGTVSLDGHDITGLAPHRRARLGVGRTFQRLELFGSLTVTENLLVAAERTAAGVIEASRRASEVLERVGVSHLAHVRADALPTGQARLVELGRALMCAPKLLLLDEPASGLDAEESTALGVLVRALAHDEGVAVLVVEHDMDLVMAICDALHVLDLGRLIASGTPEAVRTDDAVLRAYLGAST